MQGVSVVQLSAYEAQNPKTIHVYPATPTTESVIPQKKFASTCWFIPAGLMFIIFPMCWPTFCLCPPCGCTLKLDDQGNLINYMGHPSQIREFCSCGCCGLFDYARIYPDGHLSGQNQRGNHVCFCGNAQEVRDLFGR